jgi:hypothetical protein
VPPYTPTAGPLYAGLRAFVPSENAQRLSLAEVTPTSINDAAFALKDKRSAASVIKDFTINFIFIALPSLL